MFLKINEQPNDWNIHYNNYYKNILRFRESVQRREDILAVRIDSQLFFGNKDFFKKQLYKHIKNKGTSLKLVIINTEAVNYIDSSGIHILKKMQLSAN